MKRHHLGEFEHLIMLAVVRLKGRGYGVGIMTEVAAQTDREVSQAATYLTLKRLEEKGLVSGVKGEATDERGGRPRRYYTVTAAGQLKLKESRQNLLKMWSGIVEEVS